ncbi:MAG: c-type cytochrome [Myxococcota bacterium]
MQTSLVTILLALAVLTSLPARADAGKAKFEKLCAGCHGDEGHADTKKGKKLKAADYRDVAELKAPDALDYVQKTVRENKKHRKVTKKVSDEDLATIAQYVQKLAAAPK